jgi:hypothetical protein
MITSVRGCKASVTWKILSPFPGLESIFDEKGYVRGGKGRNISILPLSPIPPGC